VSDITFGRGESPSMRRGRVALNHPASSPPLPGMAIGETDEYLMTLLIHDIKRTIWATTRGPASLRETIRPMGGPRHPRLG